MRTELIIEASAGRGPRVHATGGLAARQTRPGTVHLIGTAITPLGGDHIDITLRLGPGARLAVRTVAATVALPGRATSRSTSRWTIDLREGAHLDLVPEPTIVAGTAEHEALTTITSAPGATARISERVQIGRTGEDGQGSWRGTTTAHLDDGTPLLAHALLLGARDTLGPATALDSVLELGRRAPEQGEDNSASSVLDGDPRAARAELILPRGGVLTTWVGERLPALRS
ncbi:urease accessory protein UreD [Hoyosella sp. G463]|uniref:Urease accessory protein UreD n=1 Tax=Lolliginicoccus lacisalsi TaxID=2742202 RepID=A0A927PL74_9ACTN|nr:urease accessory protein UreD [Lolliginicoccus lacisalsi]MBD8506810.1 urease accessory protein UreD [Lolliginicoccus lacisalsi]